MVWGHRSHTDGVRPRRTHAQNFASLNMFVVLLTGVSLSSLVRAVDVAWIAGGAKILCYVSKVCPEST